MWHWIKWVKDKSYSKCRQIVNSIPKTWKKLLKESHSDSSNLVLLDHRLLKNNRSLSLDEMNSKEIYSIIISSKFNIPTSRIYFEKRFLLYNFQRKDIYTLPRKVTLKPTFYLIKNYIPLVYQTHTRYLESSSGLFHWLFAFFTFNNTDSHFGVYNIDNDTFLLKMTFTQTSYT